MRLEADKLVFFARQAQDAAQAESVLSATLLAVGMCPRCALL